jgi:hypothetical protein
MARTRVPPPALEEAQGPQREVLALWMKDKVEKIQADADARAELLRTVGEHPSPIFSRMVKNFGMLGIEKKLVAKVMGITPGLLNQFYAEDYDVGAAEIISSVAANMLRIATSPDDPNNAKVGIEVLNRRGGDEWKMPAQKVITSIEKKDNVIDSSKFTYEERAAMRTMLQRIADGGEGDPVQPDEGDESAVIE